MPAQGGGATLLLWLSAVGGVLPVSPAADLVPPAKRGILIQAKRGILIQLNPASTIQ
jgi:hypothetical protein